MPKDEIRSHGSAGYGFIGLADYFHDKGLCSRHALVAKRPGVAVPEVEIEGMAGIGGLDGVPGQEAEAVLIYIIGLCKLGEGEDGGNKTLGLTSQFLSTHRILEVPGENGHRVNRNVRQGPVDDIQGFPFDGAAAVAGNKALIFDTAVPGHNKVFLASPERGSESSHTNKATLDIR